MPNCSCSIALVLSFIATAAPLWLQAESVLYPAVTSRAVWHPDAKTLEKARTACLSAPPQSVSKCFVRQMQDNGASQQAIAFAHLLHDDAYLAKFQDTGRVSIAWVIYPFRANSNTACLLVNGLPAVVDIDDLSRLPRAKLKSDPVWKALLASHPKAMLWPDDRSGMTGVSETPLPGGGQRFVAGYLVLEGCHACARLARVRYSFEFDNSGRLLGARFLDLQAIQ